MTRYERIQEEIVSINREIAKLRCTGKNDRLANKVVHDSTANLFISRTKKTNCR